MKLFRLLLGLCTHEHISWPRTRKRQTTITCLDCARTFDYDWQQMKITKPQASWRDESLDEIERIYALKEK